MGLLDSLLGDGRKFIKRKDSDAGETGPFPKFLCSYISL